MKIHQIIKLILKKYAKNKKNKIKEIIKIIEIGINKTFDKWKQEEEIEKKLIDTIDKISKMVLNYNFPIQYLQTFIEFGCSRRCLRLYINPYTLIPRIETEILVEKAFQRIMKLEIIKKYEDILIIDFGTGSGNIALYLTKLLNNNKIKTIGIDISFNALKVAQKNSIINNIEIFLLNSQNLNMIKKSKNTLIILLSNPPYLTKKEMRKELYFEPEYALLTIRKTFFYQNLINFSIENKPSISFFEIDKKSFEKLLPFLLKNQLKYSISPLQKSIYMLEILNIK